MARKIMAEHKPKRSDFTDPQRMREGPATASHQAGNDVVAEIVGAVLATGILLQDVDQDSGVEDVDSHRCQSKTRPGEDAMGCVGLLLESGDAMVRIHLHKAEAMGILQLVAFLQEAYGVKVEDEELIPQNLDSINAVSAYICRKLNGAAEGDSLAFRQDVHGGSA